MAAIDVTASTLSRRLGARLAEQRARDLYRQRRVVDAVAGTRVRIDGRELINFSSNDYLGLAGHPQVVAALREAADEYGVGAGAAHLISGHTRAHHQFEEELAAFTGRERALLFSTGYMANAGVITALTGRHDLILADRLNHASLVDAAQLSRARLQRYAHGDMAAVARLLDAGGEGWRLIVSDGVFSMDGDVAPLAQLARLAADHDAGLMIDDAHGFGVLGEGGAGSLAEAGLDAGAVPVLMGTLGKALGVFGAFVAGEAALIETLIQSARSYIYTTALPPALAAAGRAALSLVEREAWRREQVLALARRFRTGAGQLGLELLPSRTPIQPLVLGEAATALRWSAALQEAGFLVQAIRPPTVPAGSARLRITFSAGHAEADVDALLECLAALAQAAAK